MTLTYGFYNSVSQDRLYNAIQISQIFDGIIEDGVYASLGDKLMVSESTGMQIAVGSGRAWFNHTWSYNDADVLLTLDTAHALLPRIDVVYLEVNSDSATRANSINKLTGTPASTPVAPTLTNTSTVHQYPLAHVYVGAAVTAITQANITNKVGTSECPFVTGPLSVISTNDLLVQWEAEFMAWFDEMKDQLSLDAAGNLQIQINDIKGNTNPPAITLLTLKTHDHSGGNGNTIVTSGLTNECVTADKIANRTRKVFIPVTSMYKYNCGESLQTYGYVFSFDANETEMAFGYIHTPEDFVSGNIVVKLVYTKQGAGSANIRWRFERTPVMYNYGSTIEVWVSTYATLPVYGNELYIIPIVTFTNSTKGIFAFKISRYGTDPQDTLVGDADLLGLMIEYTADS